MPPPPDRLRVSNKRLENGIEGTFVLDVMQLTERSGWKAQLIACAFDLGFDGLHAT